MGSGYRRTWNILTWFRYFRQGIVFHILSQKQFGYIIFFCWYQQLGFEGNEILLIIAEFFYLFLIVFFFFFSQKKDTYQKQTYKNESSKLAQVIIKDCFLFLQDILVFNFVENIFINICFIMEGEGY